MEFENNRITLSFYGFKKFLNNLNIDVDEELMNSLCHEKYIISKNKNKYICKMRYSEDRIKKANLERLKKRSKNKNNNIIIDEKEIQLDNDLKTEIKKDSSINIIDGLPNEILNSKDEHNKHNFKDIEKCKESQTARSSSYLFNDENEQLIISPDTISDTKKDIIIDNININSKKNNNDTCNSPIYYSDKNGLVFENENESCDDINIPEEIFDIYDKLDEKDQLIDVLMDKNKELEIKLKEKDLELNNLILLIEKYKKGFTQLSLCKKDLYLTIQDIFAKSTSTVNNVIGFNNYINKTLKKESIRLIYKKKVDLDNHIEEISQELDKMQDLIIKEFNKLQNIIKENI